MMTAAGSEEFDALLAAGVAEFNAARFWDAHERWEQLWLGSSGELRNALQGVIQLAAAYHLVQRKRFSGALRLFDRARERLLASSDCPIGGVNEALESAALLRERIASGVPVILSQVDFPKLHVLSSSE
jgi:hypothetical protein